MIGHHDYLLTNVVCVISVILFSSFDCPQELFFLKKKKKKRLIEVMLKVKLNKKQEIIRFN